MLSIVGGLFRIIGTPKILSVMATPGLLRINSQDDVGCFSIVELAHRLGLALLAFILGVNFVVDVRGKLREVVCAVSADDVTFHRMGAGIGEVDDSIRQRVIVPIEHLARQHPPDGVLVLVFRVGGSRHSDAEQQQQQGRNLVLSHRISRLSLSTIALRAYCYFRCKPVSTRSSPSTCTFTSSPSNGRPFADLRPFKSAQTT